MLFVDLLCMYTLLYVSLDFDSFFFLFFWPENPTHWKTFAKSSNRFIDLDICELLARLLGTKLDLLKLRKLSE